MKLLGEEFFGKAFEHVNGINVWIIRWTVKFIFYFVLGGIVAYLLVSIYRKDFLPVVVISGFIILGEVAHYLRKTREKVMVSRVTEKNSLNKRVKNNGLLKGKVMKNKELLRKRKVVKGKVKGKVVGRKVKNKNLLKISKAKNKDMLKGV
jgi:hypothetical protein